MCNHSSYKLVKTCEKSYTFKYRYKEPGEKEFKYGIKIYEDSDLVGPLDEFYEMMQGKLEIQIWNIEIADLYKRVKVKPKKVSD